MLFVFACFVICARVVSSNDLKEADEKLLKFCQNVQDLYGKDCITPNMHLHCHLVECILDFGPVYAFWCFSFERYNGILGTYQHNNRANPIQIMRFLEDDYLSAKSDLSVLPEYTKYFGEIIDSSQDMVSGTMYLMYDSTLKKRSQLCLANPCSVSWNVDMHSTFQQPLPPFKTTCMDDTDREDLEAMFSVLFSDDESVMEIFVPQTCLELTRIQLYGEFYDCTSCPSPRANHIVASWFFKNGLVGWGDEL